ncbi:ESX secretion-associated protein EspG [Nocardia panacis]|uniref:ESX secretion-associated protein EspG n=1 Tax=Nocardia panacis TaxID=2340916 RepID=A0A3A4L9S3_9NOCA|nr:ESX secretion-associated protein EspG [Nocardia panacis]
MNWTFTPDQFALAWDRIDGDRIPYPLAVRLSARDSAERAAMLPELTAWCDAQVDADVEAALRVLAHPTICVEVFGERTEGAAMRPVRVLGAAAGNISVTAAQRPGASVERGGELRLYVGGAKTLPARVISVLPENAPGGSERLAAPLARVNEDSRDLVTVPVSGPTASARIRRLLRQPRDGIGQLVVSVRHEAELRPFGVLCWIDVAGDGRYAVRTGGDVDITPVTAEAFTAALRPMIVAAARSVEDQH